MINKYTTYHTPDGVIHVYLMGRAVVEGKKYGQQTTRSIRIVADGEDTRPPTVREDIKELFTSIAHKTFDPTSSLKTRTMTVKIVTCAGAWCENVEKFKVQTHLGVNDLWNHFLVSLEDRDD